ncbi:MAG: hypothetical protein P4L53_18525 [Candidatus Obscuribacterales bacterium]|nr:hypothetical protein [Candidatus Obscuribacterales bacterium]
MISRNVKRASLFSITLAIMCSIISAADAKGGGAAAAAASGGAAGVKAGATPAAGDIGVVPASGAPASAAGVSRGVRGIPGRNGPRNGYNNGYGYGGGVGVLNQSEGINSNPAPTGQALDAYNEKQDDRRAKLTPSATVKTYPRKKAK